MQTLRDYTQYYQQIRGQLVGEQEARGDAARQLDNAAFPTRKDEAWRYTSIERLLEKPFVIQDKLCSLSVADIQCYCHPETDTIVIADGVIQYELSHFPREAVLGSVWRSCPTENTFTHLGMVFSQGQLILEVPPHVQLSKPLQILHVTTKAECEPMMHTRLQIILGQGAEAEIVERFVAIETGRYFNNHLSHFVLGPTATCYYSYCQEEGLEACHFTQVIVEQQAASQFDAHALAFGASLGRLDFHYQASDESITKLSGGFYARGSQCLDFHIDGQHQAIGAKSDLLVKTIADDKARAVVNGKVTVVPNAQKTDASFYTHSLLLSNHAEIDSKPELEIYANDVKCAHGATIGDLDNEALFLLRARGIALEDARKILQRAFLSACVLGVRSDSTCHLLNASLQKALETETIYENI